MDFSEEQKRVIETARDWGYFRDWGKTRLDLWKGKHILDVGMGGGPHSVAYIALGARKYSGIDPAVGTDHVRDYRSQEDESIPEYHAFPYSPEEIMQLFPQIKLYSGILEDFVDELADDPPEVVGMAVVTEHLRQPREVMDGIWKIMEEGGVLFFSHANYYSWVGHHENPRTVEKWDKKNKRENTVVDWKHLAPDHHRFSDPNLNRIRMGDLRILTDNFFDIIEWKGAIVAKERLTEELRKKYHYLSLSELLTQTLYVTAIRRSKPLGHEMKSIHFFHPPQEILMQTDFSHENLDRFEYENSVYFSKSNTISSHSNNDYGGLKLFERLKEDDVLTIIKGLKKKIVTVEGVSTPEGSLTRVHIIEEVDRLIENFEQDYSNWTIVEVLRDGERIILE